MRKSIIAYLIIPVTCITILGIICHVMQQLGYGISYQVSPSMPKGWYWRTPVNTIHRGSLVLLSVDNPYKKFLISHHYIPNNGWLLKEVVGIPQDNVCIKNQALYINNQAIAKLSPQIVGDSTIPKQTFCGTLSSNEYFVLGRFHPRSYDSRYFGAVKRQNIFAIVKPIFIYESKSN